MKQNGISLNTLLKDEQISLAHLSEEEIGDEHAFTSIDTPLRPDAFDSSDEEKMATIEKHFRAIMDTLGLDLTDDSLKGTPKRVAKMYVQEIFSGLNLANKPKMALFENKYQYNQMLVEKNILFYSNCEHHFVPIIGKAHVAYISGGKVIGLSNTFFNPAGGHIVVNDRHDDAVIMRAIENDRLPRAGHMGMNAPQEIMCRLLFRGLLE